MTAVAPYALRALAGTPVAAPLEWEELDTHGSGAREHTMTSIFTRLALRGDPWAKFDRNARSLIAAHAALADDAKARSFRVARASASSDLLRLRP
jgi:bifunctional non-homologous end joining protein LigD